MSTLLDLDITDVIRVHLSSRTPGGIWIMWITGVEHTVTPTSWDVTISTALLADTRAFAWDVDYWDSGKIWS